MRIILVFLLAQGVLSELYSCPEEAEENQLKERGQWDGGRSLMVFPSRSFHVRRDPWRGERSRGVDPRRPKTITMTWMKRVMTPDGRVKAASMYRVTAGGGRAVSTTTVVSVEADGAEERERGGREALKEWATRRMMEKAMEWESRRRKWRPDFRSKPVIILRLKFRPTPAPPPRTTAPRPPVTLAPTPPLPTPPANANATRPLPAGVATPPAALKELPKAKSTSLDPSDCFLHLASLMWPSYTTHPDGFLKQIVGKTSRLFS